MKLGITHKLFFAIFLAAVLAVVCSSLVTQWSLKRGFTRLVQSIENEGIPRLATALEDEYRKSGSWKEFRDTPVRWRILIATTLSGGSSALLPGLKPCSNAQLPALGLLSPQLARQFDHRLFLQDASGNLIAGQADLTERAELTPLHYQGAVIGFLGLSLKSGTSDPSLQRFLHEQRTSLAVIGGGIIIMSALLALLLARRLVRPLRSIASATRELASGMYNVRVPVVTNDELGGLARDFNTLTLTLEKNEEIRRQWVADISHELRTPLTLLRSQVEAIQDGVRLPSAESIHVIHAEIMRITRLVDDLYQLSLTDLGVQTYRKTELDISVIIRQSVSIINPEFLAGNIELKCEAPDKLTVFGDPERLHQLFDNLLENSLKYTDSGGELQIRLWKDSGNLIIDFQDSAPGVSELELDKLFNRLYRVESSRNRATGGAGLGLTICRNIVEAHEGSITAATSPLGGVWIRIIMPCLERV